MVDHGIGNPPASDDADPIPDHGLGDHARADDPSAGHSSPTASAAACRTATRSASRSRYRSRSRRAGPELPDRVHRTATADLDCGEIPHRRFQVIGADPHRFDGDKDGVGCES